MSQKGSPSHFSPMRYEQGKLELIDQLALPNAERWVTCNTSHEVAEAIVKMIVRGAPAIGCAAAYGVAMASRALPPNDHFVVGSLDTTFTELAQTRPTAVNLFWALDQMKSVIDKNSLAKNSDLAEKLDETARQIHLDDILMCQRIGELGASLIPDGATVLTHCNTGALATGGYGTALGVIRAAREAGKNIKILANETRPYLQGARLTAWELSREGFDVTVIPDSAAAFLIQQKQVTLAIVGADRIAANGDTANKIGTYGVALACRAAEHPFLRRSPAFHDRFKNEGR